MVWLRFYCIGDNVRENNKYGHHFLRKLRTNACAALVVISAILTAGIAIGTAVAILIAALVPSYSPPSS
jgi:hypothetical protein